MDVLAFDARIAMVELETDAPASYDSITMNGYFIPWEFSPVSMNIMGSNFSTFKRLVGWNDAIDIPDAMIRDVGRFLVHPNLSLVTRELDQNYGDTPCGFSTLKTDSPALKRLPLIRIMVVILEHNPAARLDVKEKVVSAYRRLENAFLAKMMYELERTTIDTGVPENSKKSRKSPKARTSKKSS